VIQPAAAIRSIAAVDPGRPAVLYGDDVITFGQLTDAYLSFAASLVALGIGRGDVVALLMRNSPAFIEAALAVSHVGAVLLPINYRLAEDEVDYILGHSGATLTIVDAEFATVLPEARPSIIVGEDRLRDITAGVRPATGPLDAAPVSSDDLFRIMYTSGTTDRPKGVVHTYANVHWRAYAHVLALGLTSADRLLMVGPLYHVGAFDLPGLAVLGCGGLIDLHRDVDYATIRNRISEHRLTCAWLAPVMLAGLLDLPQDPGLDLSSVRWCIGGGERTPERRIKAFSSLFPRARYIDAYGLTETCSGDTLMPAGYELEKIGSVGRPVPFVEIGIFDDDGATLATGSEGEICVRGPKVTTGYWRAPDKTAATIRDGWLRTGDIGHLDADGFLFLTDRKKDMIISGAENISSSEIERVLNDLPDVREVAVIGMPNPDWGERPCASLTLADLKEHCVGKLARFKIPDRLVVREALPRNPSGKVLKRLLRDELQEEDSR
jgi:fatty-acyl-CoA synthase